MGNYYLTEAEQESAVLVGVINRNQTGKMLSEYLDELAFLADTAGAKVVKRFTQNLDTSN